MKKVDEEFFSDAEIKQRDIYPKGKKIQKLKAFDSRFENYWAGIHAPVIDAAPHDKPRLLWYDIARDVVWVYDYDKSKWALPAKRTETLPKFAFEITEERQMRHCGIVIDEEVTAKDLKGLLQEDFKL